jgi:hypothetical protein
MEHRMADPNGEDLASAGDNVCARFGYRQGAAMQRAEPSSSRHNPQNKRLNFSSSSQKHAAPRGGEHHAQI